MHKGLDETTHRPTTTGSALRYDGFVAGPHPTKQPGFATSQSYPLIQRTYIRTVWMLRQKQSTVPASGTEPPSIAAKKSQSLSTALTAGIDKLFESDF